MVREEEEEGVDDEDDAGGSLASSCWLSCLSCAGSSSETSSSSHESAMGSFFFFAFLGLGLVCEGVVAFGVSMERLEMAEAISSFSVVGCFEAIVTDLKDM